jgi:hypothetical protein
MAAAKAGPKKLSNTNIFNAPAQSSATGSNPNMDWFEEIATQNNGLQKIDGTLNNKFIASPNSFYILHTIDNIVYAYIRGDGSVESPGYKLKLKETKDYGFIPVDTNYPVIVEGTTQLKQDSKELVKKHLRNYYTIRAAKEDDLTKSDDKKLLNHVVFVTDSKDSNSKKRQYVIDNIVNPVIMLVVKSTEDLKNNMKKNIVNGTYKNDGLYDPTTPPKFFAWEPTGKERLCVFENGVWRLATEAENQYVMHDLIHEPENMKGFYFAFMKIPEQKNTGPQTLRKNQIKASNNQANTHQGNNSWKSKLQPAVGGTRYKRKQRKHRKTRKA